MTMLKQSIQSLREQAAKAWGHAKGCKKSPSDCGACQVNIKWFGELPPAVLARVLEEVYRAH